MASCLLLIPTEYELKTIPSDCLESWTRAGHRTELCGFGQIAAAARAMQLISSHSPSSVVLLGIAGLLADDLSLGIAVSFHRVVCFGIGVGEAESHVSADQLGWKHWTNDKAGNPISDEINLTPLDNTLKTGTLLSVTAGSANGHEARQRKRRFPDAVAEDMEGFGVAVACRLCGVQLSIVRGLSNQSGDRDHSHWKVAEAMEQAMKLVLKTHGIN